MNFSGSEFIRLAFLSLPCGAISMTIAKSKFFEGIRKYFMARVPIIGEGISCPYCVSHWVALVLTVIYAPEPLGLSGNWNLINYFVSMMAIVALAAIPARVIFSAYSAMIGTKDK